MRKLLLSITLALSLSGCAQIQTAFEAVATVTASVQNPVTPEMLYNVENGAIVIVAGLRGYKRACVELAIPQSCRVTIKNIQVYTRKLKPLLTDLRVFVRTNDRVNAIIAYNTIKQLIVDIKAIANANNVAVGAT